MIILTGAVVAAVLAAALLGLSFARAAGREFTRPLGGFAALLAVALLLLYLVQ